MEAINRPSLPIAIAPCGLGSPRSSRAESVESRSETWSLWRWMWDLADVSPSRQVFPRPSPARRPAQPWPLTLYDHLFSLSLERRPIRVTRSGYCTTASSPGTAGIVWPSSCCIHIGRANMVAAHPTTPDTDIHSASTTGVPVLRSSRHADTCHRFLLNSRFANCNYADVHRKTAEVTGCALGPTSSAQFLHYKLIGLKFSGLECGLPENMEHGGETTNLSRFSVTVVLVSNKGPMQKRALKIQEWLHFASPASERFACR